MAAQEPRARRFEEEPPKEPGRHPARVAMQVAFGHRIHRANEAGEIWDQAGPGRGGAVAGADEGAGLAAAGPDAPGPGRPGDGSDGDERLSERKAPSCRPRSVVATAAGTPRRFGAELTYGFPPVFEENSTSGSQVLSALAFSKPTPVSLYNVPESRRASPSFMRSVSASR